MIVFRKIIYICTLRAMSEWNAGNLEQKQSSFLLVRQMEKGNYGVKWWVTISFGKCICHSSQSPWICSKKPGLSVRSLCRAAVVRTVLQSWTSEVSYFWLALRKGAGSCQGASPATCDISWCTRRSSSCQMSTCSWKPSSCHLIYC